MNSLNMYVVLIGTTAKLNLILNLEFSRSNASLDRHRSARGNRSRRPLTLKTRISVLSPFLCQGDGDMSLEKGFRGS